MEDLIRSLGMRVAEPIDPKKTSTTEPRRLRSAAPVEDIEAAFRAARACRRATFERCSSSSRPPDPAAAAAAAAGVELVDHAPVELVDDGKSLLYCILVLFDASASILSTPDLLRRVDELVDDLAQGLRSSAAADFARWYISTSAAPSSLTVARVTDTIAQLVARPHDLLRDHRINDVALAFVSRLLGITLVLRNRHGDVAICPARPDLLQPAALIVWDDLTSAFALRRCSDLDHVQDFLASPCCPAATSGRRTKAEIARVAQSLALPVAGKTKQQLLDAIDLIVARKTSAGSHPLLNLAVELSPR